MLGALLPRHLEMIYGINRRFLDEVRALFPGDEARVIRMSLVDETGERYVRMAHLAAIGSHHVNGVARLHSDLVRQTFLRDFADLWPEKFCNVTNGVTPRRFLAVANPPLAQLITRHIGGGWLRNFDELRNENFVPVTISSESEWYSTPICVPPRICEDLHTESVRGGPTQIQGGAQIDRVAERFHNPACGLTAAALG